MGGWGRETTVTATAAAVPPHFDSQLSVTSHARRAERLAKWG